MKKVSPYSYTLILIIFFSCGKSLPSLQNIDFKQWTEDKNACGGQRVSMLDAITAQKESFLGLSEMQIMELLGRPDDNELYKRNQKFYYYLLQPAKDCKQNGLSSPLKLTIRFNAMGIAKEVSIEP